MRFPIVIHKDSDSDYGVTVPDLPGCFSAGETVGEALSNAREAIECHLEGMWEDDDPIPAPQPLHVHQANPDFSGGTWDWVRVDFDRETELTRQNAELMELLEQRARQTETVPLEEVKRQLGI